MRFQAANRFLMASVWWGSDFTDFPHLTYDKLGNW